MTENDEIKLAEEEGVSRIHVVCSQIAGRIQVQANFDDSLEKRKQLVEELREMAEYIERHIERL